MRKLFVTARYSTIKQDATYIKGLYAAISDAGWQPYCFAVERPSYDSQSKLWEDARSDIRSCQALMIDVTDSSMGGRMVEVGIAYELNIPIIVIKKPGHEHNILFDGIATKIIEYNDAADLIAPLTNLLQSS